MARLASRPSMTVACPVPPKSLHPNARKNWKSKAIDKKEYRFTVGLLARACPAIPREPWIKASILTKFFFRMKNVRDRDNLLAWCKTGYDGLQDAGVFVDDGLVTFAPVKYEYLNVKPGDGIESHVEFTVMEGDYIQDFNDMLMDEGCETLTTYFQKYFM